MTPIRHLVVVAVRLFALYIMFNAAVMLPNQIGLYLSSGTSNWFTKVASLSGVIYSFVFFAAGVLMWKHSIRITDVVVRDLPENAEFNSEVSFENNYKIAASVLGLFILTSAVPAAVILIISYLYPESNPRYIKTLDLHGSKAAEIPLVDYLSTVLQLGIGTWLFIGSESFVNGLKSIWKKSRPMGT